MHAGKLLERIFREDSSVMTGGFEAVRETRHERDPDRKNNLDVHYHRFYSAREAY